MRRKQSDKLRDMDVPMVLGCVELRRDTLTPVRHKMPVTPAGVDYGADPIGLDATGVFRWRMVPSGDVVGFEERERRLKTK